MCEKLKNNKNSSLIIVIVQLNSNKSIKKFDELRTDFVNFSKFNLKTEMNNSSKIRFKSVKKDIH